MSLRRQCPECGNWRDPPTPADALLEALRNARAERARAEGLERDLAECRRQLVAALEAAK